MAERRKDGALPEKRGESGGDEATGDTKSANGDGGGVLRRLAIPFTVGVAIGAVTVVVRRSSGYLKENVLPKLEETDVSALASKGKQLAEDAKDRVGDAVSSVGGAVSKVTGDDGENGSEPRERESAPRLDAEEREAARKDREQRRAERRQRASA